MTTTMLVARPGRTLTALCICLHGSFCDGCPHIQTSACTKVKSLSCRLCRLDRIGSQRPIVLPLCSVACTVLVNRLCFVIWDSLTYVSFLIPAIHSRFTSLALTRRSLLSSQFPIYEPVPHLRASSPYASLFLQNLSLFSEPLLGSSWFLMKHPSQH